MPRQRVEKWDNLKFMLIYLVVLGHLCDLHTGGSLPVKKITFLIYLFHMPLFLFLSGMFSKKNIDERRYRNIFSFLFLFFALKMIYAAGKIVVYHDFSFHLLKESGLPWYAFAVFAFQLISIALKRFPRAYVLGFGILLACFAGYDAKLSDVLVLSRILVFFPFFWLGYCVDDRRLYAITENRKVKAAALCVLAAFLVFYILADIHKFYWLRPILSGRNPYSALRKHAEYGFFFRLAYYLLAAVVGGAILILIPGRVGRGRIARLGSRTLQVYGLHYLLIYLLYGVFHLDSRVRGLPDGCLVLYLLALSLGITLFCSLKVWEKPFGRLLGRTPEKERG